MKKKFFGPFRVSVMLDSNGSNTTAAAGVALLAKAKKLKGKKAVVLAGTGPVGMRAAALLGKEGADVTITSRTQKKSDEAAKAIEERFGVKVKAIEAADDATRAAAVEGRQYRLCRRRHRRSSSCRSRPGRTIPTSRWSPT